MTRGIRSCALAAGAAALLSAQAVYAAPVPVRSSGVDPLVTLSVLGTTQSRAAVCQSAGSSACAVPSAALAASAASAAAAQGVPPPPPGKTVSPWLMILGLAILIGIVIAITSGGGDSSGDLTPVSPQ